MFAGCSCGLELPTGLRLGRDRDSTNGVLGFVRALTVGLVRCQGWGLGGWGLVR